MCLMQDDGKAVQAFRPGHSAQVVNCSKCERAKCAFAERDKVKSFRCPSGGDQGREGLLPGHGQWPRLRPVQASRAAGGGDAFQADRRRGGEGVRVPV